MPRVEQRSGAPDSSDTLGEASATCDIWYSVRNTPGPWADFGRSGGPRRPSECQARPRSYAAANLASVRRVRQIESRLGGGKGPDRPPGIRPDGNANEAEESERTAGNVATAGAKMP